MKAENNNTNIPAVHKCKECDMEFLVEEPEVVSLVKVVTINYKYCAPCGFTKRYGK